MRKLSLVLSFVVTAIMATLAYNYASGQVGERRSHVQESWLDSSGAEALSSRADARDRPTDVTAPILGAAGQPTSVIQR
jgi:hypothetical protein